MVIWTESNFAQAFVTGGWEDEDEAQKHQWSSLAQKHQLWSFLAQQKKSFLAHQKQIYKLVDFD